MPYTKDIICLASSTKHYPCRCIAGLEYDEDEDEIGDWIRPVSADNSIEGAITPAQSRMDNGREVRPLDIVRITFEGERPHAAQSENHLISDQRWEYRGQADFEMVEDLIQEYRGLWANGNSTAGGLNDKVLPYQFNQYNDSLRLIEVTDFAFVVKTKAFNGRRVMKGNFTYNDEPYSLTVTDPALSAQMRDRAIDQPHHVGRAILSISLSDLHRDSQCHYKLIAGAFWE